MAEGEVKNGRSLLVIGGSGFFGKSFLDAYQRGLLAPWTIDRVMVVARSASALRRTHPDLVAGGVALIDADIGQTETLPVADYVIHAASSTDARRYAENPERESANILAAVENYCRIAARCHRNSRIVYTSSGAVYGAQPGDVACLSEDDPFRGAAGLASYKQAYAEAKRAAEAHIADLGKAGLRVAVARCFAFVGYYLPRDQHFAIGNFLADGLSDRAITVHAPRPVVRSYMHADDLVRWLMTIAAAAQNDCDTFNVGSEEAVNIVELADMVAARYGVPVTCADQSSTEPDRYVPCTARARQTLGLECRYDLAASLDDMRRRLAA